MGTGGGAGGLGDPLQRARDSAVRLVVALFNPESVEISAKSVDAPTDRSTAMVWHRTNNNTDDFVTLSDIAPEGAQPESAADRIISLANGWTMTIRRPTWGPTDADQLEAVGRVIDTLLEEQERAAHTEQRLKVSATTLISTDADLRITAIEQTGESETITELLAVGVVLSDLFDSRDIPELERRAQLASAADAKGPFTIGTALAGGSRFANFTFVPARDSQGGLTGFGVQIVDRSREIELIQRSDRNRRLGTQIIDGAPLGVVVFNQQRQVERSNAIAHHFLGAIEGLALDQLEIDPEVADELQLTFDTGEPGAFEWRHPTIALSCTVAPSFDVSELSHVIWYLDPRTDTRNAETVGNLDLELSIREAIEEQTIGLRFQPEFDANTGELTAIEALALAHTHNRVMTGEQFIPTAEAAGIVGAVDAAVLASAIAQAAIWVREGWSDAVVRINVSTTTLRDRTFVERLTSHLLLNNLPGRHICLEITETGVISDPVLAEEVMAAIRSLDVTIALDDFGTGQSSLGRLARFGTDVLKLDQSFASQVHQNEETRVVIEAIVQLAHRLGAIVVAEGVENERQRAALTELGCDRLQGHFLSRPLATEHVDITRLIAGPLPAIVGSTSETIDLRD